MRRVLIVTTGLIFVLSLLVTATRFLGHTDDSAMVVVENSYHCLPESCWHDIRPGVTKWDQVLKILQADSKITNAGRGGDGLIFFKIPGVFPELQGYIMETSAKAPNGRILTGDIVELNMSESVTLADAIMLYGTPIGVQICHSQRDLLVVFFKDNISIASNMDKILATHYRDWLTPSFHFDHVTYDMEGVSSVYTHQLPWRGFTALSTYVCSDDK